jgi:hypothetical protein
VDDAVRKRTNKQLVVRREHNRTTRVKVIPKSVEKVMPRMRILTE